MQEHICNELGRQWSEPILFRFLCAIIPCEQRSGVSLVCSQKLAVLSWLCDRLKSLGVYRKFRCRKSLPRPGFPMACLEWADWRLHLWDCHSQEPRCRVSYLRRGRVLVVSNIGKGDTAYQNVCWSYQACQLCCVIEYFQQPWRCPIRETMWASF